MDENPDQEAAIQAMLKKFREQLEQTLPDGDLTLDEIGDVAEVLGNDVKREVLHYLKTGAVPGSELSGGC